MVEFFFKIKRQKLQRIKEPRAGAWINIENVSQEDLELIENLTDLNSTDLEDIFDLYELPRIERKGSALMLFLRDAQPASVEGEEILTSPLVLIITEKYFFSISNKKNETIRRIIKENVNITTTKRSKFLIYVLLQISKDFTKEIKKISHFISQKKKLKKIANADIVNLIQQETILNSYISALSPMRIVFEAIATGNYIGLYEEDEDLIEDMIISIRQSVENCSGNIKTIRSLRDSYQVIFTNRLNKTIRLLTSLTVILAVPTMIASFLGMNVAFPFNAESSAIFLNIVSISAAASIILLYIFIVKKWF